jgi:histone H3/H4
MRETGKFLDYSGPVDYEVIDRLLKNLKNTGEYIGLNKSAAKRIYAIIEECLENIAKHSIKNTKSAIRKTPFITASDINDKILIRSGNTILDEKRPRLIKILEHVNSLNQDDLIHLYEEIINRELRSEDNGAGLGFIIMKLRSGNKLDYNFKESGNGISDFEIQISVNKYAMRKLFIERTTNSPKVNFDPENNIFEISGESRPPDVAGFYTEILNWFDDYSTYLSKSQLVKDPVVFNFDFEYFNSSSAKYILDFCKQIAAVRSKGKEVGVIWNYEKDDNDMLEVGKEMSRIARVPFHFSLKDI